MDQMTNAAIYLAPDGYDTSGAKLMGRHSAGESFLRGYLRHAAVEGLHLFNAVGRPVSELETLVSQIQTPRHPITWYGPRDRKRLGSAGCLYYPSPNLAQEAWSRRPFGSKLYSLCGITHTTASHRAMDAIAELTTAPVEPWDALICTSAAVRAAVEVELDAVRADLTERLGATRFPGPKLATIPLGVNCSDFATTPTERARWRAALGIPTDAVVALYVGRFNTVAKMNPAMMAMVLEASAKETGQQIYWIVAGWAANEELAALHHAQTRAFCPSVHYRAVDGRPKDTRYSIWSAADFFISFSDNVQETFGLTPIEAMAAGLPSVVTDWNGYRDTIRHGVDGFRIDTYAPRPGLGRDLAYAYANQWVPYEKYLAAAAQMTAIDLRGATRAVTALVTNPDLRARMGAAAAQRAQEIFDWANIVPQYQALWAELAAIRISANSPPGLPTGDPRRLDPFTLFASYPTDVLTPQTRLCVLPQLDWLVARERLQQPLGSVGRWALPNVVEMEQAFEFYASHPHEQVLKLLQRYPQQRRPFIERGLLWLVKFGALAITRPEGLRAISDAGTSPDEGMGGRIAG